MAEQIQTGDFPHQQVSAAMLGQKRLEKYPSTTSEGELTAHATPRAKQFRDDIEALKEFDEGDELVCELHGNLIKVFSSHVDSFSALDLNVIRARHGCRATPPPGTRREFGDVPEKETHKTHQCRCWTREGERYTDFFESHKARVAQEVHSPVFWAARTH